MKTGLHIILLLTLLQLSLPAGADAVYRCQRDSQTPVYSDHVCGPDAQRIKVPPPAATAVAPEFNPKSTATPQPPVNITNQNTVNVTPPAAPATATAHGLPFADYRLLDTGMSEGKVLSIAGPPDRETVDAVDTRAGIKRKSYYYISRGYNASITHIEFVNGRVRSLDRSLVLPH